MWALQVDAIYSSPLSRAKETAQSIADLQSLAGYSQPPVSACDDLNNRDWGSLEGREASEVPAVFLPAYEHSPAFLKLQAASTITGMHACELLQKLLPGHICATKCSLTALPCTYSQQGWWVHMHVHMRIQTDVHILHGDPALCVLRRHSKGACSALWALHA